MKEFESKDELLHQLHLKYIEQVSESGIPLWVFHMYDRGYFGPEDCLRKNEKDEAQDKADYDQRKEIHDLPF